MFFLYEQTTGKLLAIMADTDARFLLNCAADENLDYRSFIVNDRVLADLKHRGGDPDFIAIIRQALGNEIETTVCWGRNQESKVPADTVLE
jgi:hypothetical protein